jgi:hypothetical protein
LLAYAENLVDQREAIDRTMAAHLSACPQCKAEVAAIQASLSFTESAPELEPTSDLTARILMAGKAERREQRNEVTPVRMAVKLVQGVSCAAAMVAVMGLSFSAFLGSSESPQESPAFAGAVPVVEGSPGRSPEALRQATVEVAAEVRTLTEAVASKREGATSPEALEEMRVVQSRDADIAAAVSALERNPHSVRATHVVHATLKRQAESLRTIYTEGGGNL